MRLAGEGSRPDEREGGRASAERDGADERDERFPREARVRRRPEFLRIQRNGARVHTPHYVVVIMPKPDAEKARRFGVTVTKKVAGAVGRNRVKRVLREIFRRNRHMFPESCDVVMIAKSGATALGYEEAKAELAKIRGPLTSAARRIGRRTAPPEGR